MVESLIPLLVILCPASAAPLILLFGKHPNIREGWTIAAGLAMFSLIFSMIHTVLSGDVVDCVLFQTMFRDSLSGYLKIAVSYTHLTLPTN